LKQIVKLDECGSGLHFPKYLRLLIQVSVGIVAFAIFLLFFHIDVGKVGSLIASLNPLLLVLVLVVDVLNILCYGTAWYFLVYTVFPTARLMKCVEGVMISIFGDILIPTGSVTGEALRLNFANKDFGLPYPEGVATVVAHRVLNGLASGTILAVGLSVLIVGGELSGSLRGYIFLLFVFVMVPTFFGLAVLVHPGIGSRLVVRVLGRFANRPRTAKMVQRIIGGVAGFERSVKLIRAHGRNLPYSFVFLIFQWFFQVLIPYFFLIGVSQTLGLPISYWTYFWFVSVAFPIFGLVNLVPLGVPGNLGIIDSAMAATFILLGFRADVAIATTLLTRIVLVVFELIICGAVVAHVGYRSIKSRKASLPAVPEVPGSGSGTPSLDNGAEGHL
jgi:uncharacterized protein (TIRG00374 family)